MAVSRSGDVEVASGTCFTQGEIRGKGSGTRGVGTCGGPGHKSDLDTKVIRVVAGVAEGRRGAIDLTGEPGRNKGTA